jgi:hypothetical protein
LSEKYITKYPSPIGPLNGAEAYVEEQARKGELWRLKYCRPSKTFPVYVNYLKANLHKFYFMCKSSDSEGMRSTSNKYKSWRKHEYFTLGDHTERAKMVTKNDLSTK